MANPEAQKLEQKSLADIHNILGISQKHLSHYKLKLTPQPDLRTLEVVDIDLEGKPFILKSSAANSWREMQTQAEMEKIYLKPFSGFRSYIHQMNLIKRQIERGRNLDEILKNIAIPGFSEHHSGCAVDIHADGQWSLEEDFEKTDEFKWLLKNASRFQFQMSYPRNNDLNIVYEPWHWLYRGN